MLTKPGLFYEHTATNLDNPILADLRVRQALLYGLDRAGISEEMYGGKQPVADTLVHPLDWVHTDDVRKYLYDPAQARALLEAAGWHPGSDGVRHNEKGERLSLDLATTSGNRTRELLEQIMQSQWREIGVEVRARWGGVRRVAMLHRIGRLEIGESSVLIAVSAAHRGEAFEACRYAIDTLKRTVPVWKKEHFEDGEVWVGLQGG